MLHDGRLETRLKHAEIQECPESCHRPRSLVPPAAAHCMHQLCSSNNLAVKNIAKMKSAPLDLNEHGGKNRRDNEVKRIVCHHLACATSLEGLLQATD